MPSRPTAKRDHAAARSRIASWSLQEYQPCRADYAPHLGWSEWPCAYASLRWQSHLRLRSAKRRAVELWSLQRLDSLEAQPCNLLSACTEPCWSALAFTCQRCNAGCFDDSCMIKQSQLCTLYCLRGA